MRSFAILTAEVRVKTPVCLFTLSPVKNCTGVATEVVFHAVSHRRSVNSTSKYNRNRTGGISHWCSVNGALIIFSKTTSLNEVDNIPTLDVIFYTNPKIHLFKLHADTANSVKNGCGTHCTESKYILTTQQVQ